MSEALHLILALVAGALIGAIFFGGLWWTIRRGLASPRPALLFLSSLVLRAAIAVGGFYCVARGDWRRLSACMAGFLLVRLLAIRRIREPVGRGPGLARGGGT